MVDLDMVDTQPDSGWTEDQLDKNAAAQGPKMEV